MQRYKKDTEKEQKIHFLNAVKNGDVDTIKSYFEQGDSSYVLFRDKQGMAPLHHAAISGNLEVVQTILYKLKEVGRLIKLNEPADSGLTALHLAAKNGHLEVVEYLEAEGAFIYSSDYRGKTLLHLAVESNHSEVVEFLLEVGTSSEVLGTCGQTPLYFAAEHGSHDAVNKLLEKGADPDKSGGSSDRGPIYAAIKSGNVDCVELLLKHGANPDGSNEMPQIRPLHKALKLEPEELRKKMVELLIKYKADVCKPGFSGSPLDVAVKHPPFEGWLKSFVSWGAKIPTNVFEEKDGSEFKAAADELAQIYATTSDDVALAGAEGSGEVADIV